MLAAHHSLISTRCFAAKTHPRRKELRHCGRCNVRPAEQCGSAPLLPRRGMLRALGRKPSWCRAYSWLAASGRRTRAAAPPAPTARWSQPRSPMHAGPFRRPAAAHLDGWSCSGCAACLFLRLRNLSRRGSASKMRNRLIAAVRSWALPFAASFLKHCFVMLNRSMPTRKW